MKMDYTNEMKHLQQAIMFHPLNSDFWLKLAKCYYCLLDKPIGDSVPFNLSLRNDATWLYAGSLIRFEIIIRSVSGKADTYTKKRGQQILLSEVHPFIANLPQGFKEKTYEVISIVNCYNFLRRNVQVLNVSNFFLFCTLFFSRHLAAMFIIRNLKKIQPSSI